MPVKSLGLFNSRIEFIINEKLLFVLIATEEVFSILQEPLVELLCIENQNYQDSSDKINRSQFFSFFRQTLFEFEDKLQPKNDEVYHFVGYIPFENRLYELDGLRQGPIDLGSIPPGTDWLNVVQPVIQQRIQK